MSRHSALRVVLLTKTFFCFGVWGLPAMFAPPALLDLFDLALPADPFFFRLLGGVITALGVLYWFAYRDPIRNVAIIKYGIVDNAIATATFLYFGLTTGLPSPFFWASAVFTAFFVVVFAVLLPRES